MFPSKVYLFIFTLLLLSLTNQGLCHVIPTTPNDDWNPVSTGPINTWTASLEPAGELNTQLFVFYTMTTGFYDGAGKFWSLPDNTTKTQFQEQLFLQYAINPMFEMDAQLSTFQNTLKVGDQTSYYSGPGDSIFFLRYAIATETHPYPFLTGVLQLRVPSGNFLNQTSTLRTSDLTGTGSVGSGYGVDGHQKTQTILAAYRPHLQCTLTDPDQYHFY